MRNCARQLSSRSPPSSSWPVAFTAARVNHMFLRCLLLLACMVLCDGGVFSKRLLREEACREQLGTLCVRRFVETRNTSVLKPSTREVTGLVKIYFFSTATIVTSISTSSPTDFLLTFFHRCTATLFRPCVHSFFNFYLFLQMSISFYFWAFFLTVSLLKMLLFGSMKIIMGVVHDNDAKEHRTISDFLHPLATRGSKCTSASL